MYILQLAKRMLLCPRSWLTDEANSKHSLSNNTESFDLVIKCGKKAFKADKATLAHRSGFFRQLLHPNAQVLDENLRFRNLISRNDEYRAPPFETLSHPYFIWIGLFVLAIPTITGVFHFSFSKDWSTAIVRAACIMLLIFFAAYVGQEDLTRTPCTIKVGEIDVGTGKSVIELSDDNPFVVGVILKFLHGIRFPDASDCYAGELDERCGSLEDLAVVYLALDKYDIPDLKENLLGFMESLCETLSSDPDPEDFPDLAEAFQTMAGARSVEDKFNRFLIDLVQDLASIELNVEMEKLRSDLLGRIASQALERGPTANGSSSPKSLTMASFFNWLSLRPSFLSIWTWSLER